MEEKIRKATHYYCIRKKMYDMTSCLVCSSYSSLIDPCTLFPHWGKLGILHSPNDLHAEMPFAFVVLELTA